MTASKNYYAILGVDKKATSDEIRSAYRKLARKYHPDHNPGDKEAEAKFKEAVEAYEVLSDPAERKKYDTPERGTRGRTPRKPPGSTSPWDFDSFMQEAFGDAGPATQDDGPDPEDAAPRERKSTRSTASKQSFRREGNDAYTTVTINALEALLGTKCEIVNPEGKKVRVRIDAGTPSRKKIRLRGQRVAFGKQRGDLHIAIEVTTLSPKQREKLRAWATQEGLI